MHIFTACVQAGLWGAAGYVATHLYYDLRGEWTWRHRTPFIPWHSNALRSEDQPHARR